jgi:integrase
MRQHLTEAGVRALKPADKQFKVMDSSTPGFGVLVSGKSKSWIVVHGPKRKLRVLGKFPDLGLADARRSAKSIMLSPDEKPDSPKFAEAARQFLDTQDHLAAITRRDYQRLMNTRFVPALTHRRLADIETRHVTAILDELADRPGERKYAHSVIRRFFKWAVGRRLIDRSPLEGFDVPKPVASRDRVLSDHELKCIWQACEPREGVGDAAVEPGRSDQATFSQPISPTFAAIVKLLILTGQRKSEITNLQTSWINDDHITLPKEITKNGREHQFPIGPLASSLIASVVSSRENGLLFPARGLECSPFNGFSKAKLALDNKLGPDFKPWTIHDLRRTFATNLAGMGVRIEVTERLLNHISNTQGGLIGTYQRFDFAEQKREAIELWESRLAEIVVQ